MSFLTLYHVRFECRTPGSLGSFHVRIVPALAPNPHAAVDMARESLSAFELRCGGDVREPDSADWRTPDGKLQPMILPCQSEAPDANRFRP